MTAFATVPMLSLPELARFASGDLVAREVPRDPRAREAWLKEGVDGVSIDTRTIGPGQLFVPLRGGRADGHAFLDEAFRRGAAAALCERAAYAALAGKEPGPLVLVDDATAALQRLAKRWRDQWAGLALGVTGSAGKTTTKDLTALVLGALGSTLKTEGNLNNHWGVPLTLLRLRPEHRAAVIEVAMSNPGEIAMLASLVAPQAAIITNAGTAHLEGMGSLEAIAAEKAELARAVPPGQPVFAGMDSPRLIAALAGLPCRVITFGFAARADVRPMRIEERGEEGVVFEVKGFPAVHLRLFGRHQVANALAALAVAREYGVDPRAAVDALEAYRPSKGRMEIAHAGGATLLIDTYNANPDSTRAALATLAGWPRASARIAVLGDMLELGPDAAQLHRETAAEARVSEVWVVGAHARDLERGARDAGAEVRVFEDKASLGAALAARLAPGLVVLLKASRGAALEDVLAGIERED